jgi:transcriptional regulator with XRE-family HTH domain
MLEQTRIIIATNYSGEPLLAIHICVVELSLIIELIQQFVIQWEIQEETILMTPEQTVQLIKLLSNKRKESDLSVNEVARRADVDPGTLWRIEQGMIPTPKAESLLAIGEVLDIPSIDLFTIVGWMPKNELPTIGRDNEKPAHGGAGLKQHLLVPPAGFEPATPALGEPCSIP